MKMNKSTAGAILAVAIGIVSSPGAYAQWAHTLTTSGDRMQSLQSAYVKADDRASQQNAIVLSDTRNQKIDGFGYAITYASCKNILSMPKEAQDKLLRKTFSPKDGYGVSYVRISLGCNDFSSKEYSLCDTQGPAGNPLKNFGLSTDETKYVIPVLKRILEINPGLKVIAAPWTSPRWMKIKDPGQTAVYNSWTGGRLNPKYYKTYGEYFAKFIKAMKDQGIDIYAISPQNEPLNPGNSASLYMHWEEQADFVIQGLAPALNEAGLKTKIYLFDHNFNYDNKAEERNYPILCFNKMDNTTFKGSDLVVGSCWHSYGGSVKDISNVVNRKSKELLFTEASIGTWNNGRDLMATLTRDMNELVIDNMNSRMVGSIVWNFMLDMNRGPNRPGGCTTCDGAINIDQSQYKSYLYNSHYYIMAHASDAVKPGAYHVSATGTAPSGLKYSAFVNPDNTQAILLSNTSNKAIDAKVYADGRSYTFTVPPKGVVSAQMGLQEEGQVPGPVTGPKVTITGDATESGEATELSPLVINGDEMYLYEYWGKLKPGSFGIDVAQNGETVSYGVKNGKLDKQGDGYKVASEQIAAVRVDLSTNEVTVIPVTSISIVGSAVKGGWSETSGTPIPYVGNGVWKDKVVLNGTPSDNDPSRIVFVINNTWNVSPIKHIIGTTNGAAQEGTTIVEDVYVDTGTYDVTLDMQNHTFEFKKGSAIENIAAADGLAVAPVKGSISLRNVGAQPVKASVVSLQGITIWTGVVEDTVTVTLHPGIYIVNGKKYAVK